MSARAVQDFYVFTDNPRIKTYNGIPQKPGYHKPVKPSRALRRLLTAFRYEVKGVSPIEKYGRQFADGKDRKQRKHLRNRTTRIRTWECSSQSAVPYRLAIVLNSGRETICSRIIFVKHSIQNFHACTRYSVKLSVVERIISFFISRTQATYTFDALISPTHIQCQHYTRYSAITMAL